MEAKILDALPTYLFLRTFSLQLQLSPFEAEAFLSCIESPHHSPLIDEIHCTLLRACIQLFREENPKLSGRVDWSSLDSFTWTEYLLPLLLEYRLLYRRDRTAVSWGDEASSELNDVLEVVQILTESKSLGINYINTSTRTKLLTLQCLISLLLSNDKFKKLIEYRGEIEQEVSNVLSSDDQGNTLPLFPKGEDGFPEECIICGLGGDLLCCDMCPAAYHQSCLQTNPKDFEQTWACYECSTLDPMNSRLRLPVNIIDSMSLSFVGRFVLQNHQIEDSSGSCFRILGASDVIRIVDCLSKSEISAWPWKNYRTALDRLRLFNNRVRPKSASCERSDVGMTDSEIDSIAAAYDSRLIEAVGNTLEDISLTAPIDGKRCSARLSTLEEIKADADVRLQERSEPISDIDRLSAQFDPHSYFNRYCDLKHNVYLGTKAQVSGLSAAAEADLGLLNTSTVYSKSCFSSLGGCLEVTLDEQRMKEGEKDEDCTATTTAADNLTRCYTPSSWPLYSQPPTRSLCRFLEAMHLTLGALRTTPLERHTGRHTSTSTSPLPWLVRLSIAEDLGSVKRLAVEMVDEIHPCAFKPNWFLSAPEGVDSGPQSSSTSSSSSSSSLQLKGQFWIGQHPKTGSLRVPSFLHLSQVLLEAEKSSGRDGASVESESSDEEGSQREEEVEGEVEGEKGDRSAVGSKGCAKEEENGYGDDDDDDSVGKKRGHNAHQLPRLSPMISGRNCTFYSQRARVPPNLLRKLARLGGRALLPFAVYPKCPVAFALPPFAWQWSYRLRKSLTAESVGLQLRCLESHLKTRDLPVGMLGRKSQNCSSVSWVALEDERARGMVLLDSSFSLYRSDSSPSYLEHPQQSLSNVTQIKRESGDTAEGMDSVFCEGGTSMGSVTDMLDMNGMEADGATSVCISSTRSSAASLSTAASFSSITSSKCSLPSPLPSVTPHSSTAKHQSSPRPTRASCWWRACHGDVVSFAASSSKLQQHSQFASSSPLTLIANYPKESGPRDFWVDYDNALQTYLRSWASRVLTEGVYKMTVTREGNGEVSLPIACVQNLLIRQHATDLILRYRALSSQQQQPQLNGLKNEFYPTASCALDSINCVSAGEDLNLNSLLGEFCETVVDILMEGGTLNTECNELANVKVGEVIIHTTLYEEIQSIKAATQSILVNLLIKSESEEKDSASSMKGYTASLKRGRNGVLEGAVKFESTDGGGSLRKERATTSKQRPSVGVVFESVVEGMLNELLVAAAAMLKCQVVATPNLLDTFRDTAATTPTATEAGTGAGTAAGGAMVKMEVTASPPSTLSPSQHLHTQQIAPLPPSRVQELLSTIPLPLLQGDPLCSHYPLLSDPAASYLTSTATFLRTFSALTRLSSASKMEAAERVLASVFRNRFFRPSNKLRDIQSSLLAGSVYRRKLKIQEQPSIIRSMCTAADGPGANTQIYVPQVGDELLYFPKGHAQYDALYCDRAPQTSGLTKRKRTLLSSENCPDWIACRIATVDYEFPPEAGPEGGVVVGSKDWLAGGLVMVLQLQPIHIMGPLRDLEKEQEGVRAGLVGEAHGQGPKANKNPLFSLKRTFFVLYRPGHECPEFLIRRQLLRQCFQNRWHLDVRTRSNPVAAESSSEQPVGCVVPAPIPVPVPVPVPVAVSTAQLSNSVTIECTRRFMCTYDSGEVWSGTVVRLVRDPWGVPLWSGASVVWDSEVEAASLEGRDIAEDYLNEWELEVEPVTESDSMMCLSEGAEGKGEKELVEVVEVEVNSEDSKTASAVVNKSKVKGKKSAEKNGRKHLADVGENPDMKDEGHEEEDGKGEGEGKIEVINIAAHGNHLEVDGGIGGEGDGEDVVIVTDNSNAADKGDSSQEVRIETSQEAEPQAEEKEESVSKQEETSASQGLRRGTRVAVAPSDPNACGSTSNIGHNKHGNCKKKKSIGKGGKGGNQMCKANPVERESEKDKERDRERDRNGDGSSGPRIRGTDSSPPTKGPVLPVLSDKHLRSLHLEWVNRSIFGVLDKMISLAEFEAFANQIDAATAPEYDLLIPANVHLSLMRQRALNLHYRQPQACLADARTIFLNALYYNGALSPIALRAAELYRAVLRALRWIFPDDDFRDYCCFDPCLRGMLPLGPLLAPLGIVATAAVDRHTGARDRADRISRNRSEGRTDERRRHTDDDDDDSDDELYQYLVQDDDAGKLISEVRQLDSTVTASATALKGEGLGDENGDEYEDEDGDEHEDEDEDEDEGEKSNADSYYF